MLCIAALRSVAQTRLSRTTLIVNQECRVHGLIQAHGTLQLTCENARFSQVNVRERKRSGGHDLAEPPEPSLATLTAGSSGRRRGAAAIARAAADARRAPSTELAYASDWRDFSALPHGSVPSRCQPVAHHVGETALKRYVELLELSAS